MNKQIIVSNVDTAMLTSGVLVGLSQIQSIIGIVLVSVQLAWIVTKFGVKIYNSVKSKKFNSIQSQMDDFSKDMNELKEKINGVLNG